jgi:hypothetical protein
VSAPVPAKVDLSIAESLLARAEKAEGERDALQAKLDRILTLLDSDRDGAHESYEEARGERALKGASPERDRAVAIEYAIYSATGAAAKAVRRIVES